MSASAKQSRPPAPKPTLRARVVRHVLAPLVLTWLLGTSLTVAVAYYFAQKAYDRALLDDAFALASRVRAQPQGLVLELTNREMSAVLFDQSERIYFLVQRSDGSIIAGHPALHAPLPQPPEDVRFGETIYQGQRLRTVSLLQDQPQPFQVVVAQTLGSRNALLHDVLTYSVAPQLLLLLLLAQWVRLSIGRDLRQLAELQRFIEQRDAMDLSPLQVAAGTRDIEHLKLAINALLARLRHSLDAQREFSGNVAHELRTPLAGIRALAEYGLAQTEPAVWREQLLRIVSSEGRASRMVDQLLALALAEESGDSVKIEAVALDEIARETVLRYMPRADAAGVDLGGHNLEQAVRVLGNVALIEGVLGNLLDNALRYAHAPQGLTSTVTVELETQAERVLLSVIDNGPGLDAQQCERLLARGVRGLDASAGQQGVGLGLAIVAQFARLMQGELSLTAAPSGQGLKASVSLRRA